MERWHLLITESSCFELIGDGKYDLFFSQKVNWKMIFTWSFWAFYDIPGLGKYCFSCSAVLKDQAKFDTQNLVISSLLTLIEIGKKQKEEKTKKHLSRASSVQDLKIAKRFKRLSQFSINRPIDCSDDNDDDNNGKTPSALAQRIMLGIDDQRQHKQRQLQSKN